MKRLERDALLADRATVARMLSRLPEGDVLGRSSFEARLSEIDAELETIEARLETGGSVALLFGGAPVHGSRAIDAEFTTKAVSNFHSLIVKKLAFEDLGSLGSRGPVPARTEVNLDITEIVRGSVGFLLEEKTTHAEIADTAAKIAIDEVTELVAKAASEDESEFEQAVETLDPRLVVSLRDFFRTLDDGRATIRIVEDALDATLDTLAIRRARERVELTEIQDTESEHVIGELLGLLPDSRRFEMRLKESGEVIKGAVAAAYAPQYLQLIEQPGQGIVGRSWRAKMKIREIRERNKPPRKLYTLIGLLEQLDGTEDG